jgi:MtN3 and saliva related transmembrane protein
VKWVTTLGFIAAACTTMAFLPQVIKTCRLKETRDISLVMYIVLVTGISLWALYGILIGDYPVSIANGITLILAVIILISKIRYG